MILKPKPGMDRMNRTDLLLFLLYAAGPSGKNCETIGGKTRLQKEVFLAQKDLKDKNIKSNYFFRPYHYGPYSIELYDDVNWLASEGIIEIRKIRLEKRGIYTEYKLTSKGINEMEQKLDDPNMKISFDIISGIKKQYNKMNIVSLVEYTHNKYPEYDGSK